MSMPTEEEETLARMINYHEGEIKILMERYPGVCPGWVSADISWHRYRADKYKEQLKELKSE